MKNLIIALLIGIILGAGGLWYYQQETSALREAEERASRTAAAARKAVSDAAVDARDAVAAKLEALELRAQDIKEDLSRSGRIVRRKARELGEAAAEATADAAITARIKGKLAADPLLSAMGISVDTTAGRVTLAGTAPSHEAIGRAMLLALETEGVREVVSTLQVKQTPS